MHSLNDKQKKILESLRELTDNLDLFMSTPNPLFRNKTPIEMLLQEEYQYFEQFIKQ